MEANQLVEGDRNSVSKWQGSSHMVGIHEQDTNTLERKLLSIKTLIPREKWGTQRSS